MSDRKPRSFFIAGEDEIRAGKTSDVYFQRSLGILEKLDVQKRVVAEVVAKGLPRDWSYAVFAGLQEAAELFSPLGVKVWAMTEGTLFLPYEPVLVIEGEYRAFGLFETALLGFLCQASGVATAAARYRRAAGEKKLFSFGARRMHPAITPMIERSAFIGGCDGVSAILGAELLGESPVGTVPHALILILGDTVEAARAFDAHVSPEVSRVVLIDTFQDEKFEALRVADALGERLSAVRLDTPASRRGNFRKILEEVRWELDLRGYERVNIVVSGGIQEGDLPELNMYVDAYGIGTSISNAPVIDFSLDIVEIEGRPIAKRGKRSGRKQVYRCPHCFRDQVRSWPPAREVSVACECGGESEPLLIPLVDERGPAGKIPSPREIREYVFNQLERIDVS